MLSCPLKLQLLDIPLSEIYSFMGYRDSLPDMETRRTTERLLQEAGRYVCPQFEYFITDGIQTDHTVVFGTVTLETGRIIARQLRGSSKFALFVATAGSGWTLWMEQLKQRNDLFETYVADCIGSQIAESTIDYMEKILQKELDFNSLKRTNRFSPGYCGWHVSQQKLLFSLFPEDNPCGIKLTESSLMLPVKSVSGIIGVGADVRYMPYTCNICTMNSCLRRRR